MLSFTKIMSGGRIFNAAARNGSAIPNLALDQDRAL